MAAENEKKYLLSVKKLLKKFSAKLNPVQRSMYGAVVQEINRLELDASGNIKTTIKNLSILASIQNKMARVIVTDEYTQSVKELVKGFGELTKLQNAYWKEIEPTFKPRRLLKAIRVQAVKDTVENLIGSGVKANVSDRVTDIIKTSITTGGSYEDLAGQLREGLLDTADKGYLTRYAKQIATDSVNQYSAQYSKIVASDLGYTWYRYSGSDIETTRCFCDAMTDKQYFHISEIPKLLRGEGLECTDKKTGNKIPVKINPTTKLPYGMIKGTDASNFQVNRGGWNCGHQIYPVDEDQIPSDVLAKVKASAAYKSWEALNQPAK